VAATNHPELLDRAMFRRFDTVIAYPLPSTELARAVIRNRLANVRVGRLAWKKIDEAAAGLSHSEITQAAERAAKDAILAGEAGVTTAALVAALTERHARSHP
jgi:AAA+ superfamily predicted ATPase